MTELRCIVSSVSVGLPGVYSSSLELSPPPATTTSAHTHTHSTYHTGWGYTQYISYRVGGTHSTCHTGWGVHTVHIIQGGGYTVHIIQGGGYTQYVSYRVGGTLLTSIIARRPTLTVSLTQASSLGCHSYLTLPSQHTITQRAVT